MHCCSKNIYGHFFFELFRTLAGNPLASGGRLAVGEDKSIMEAPGEPKVRRRAFAARLTCCCKRGSLQDRARTKVGWKVALSHLGEQHGEGGGLGILSRRLAEIRLERFCCAMHLSDVSSASARYISDSVRCKQLA
mmetsp:Transcript_27457/g.45771  ORF Transcript_27457/g.45771 Transcript_27457/m.45771 type:complete len:136 (-) Transcript_27457:112-519(-)